MESKDNDHMEQASTGNSNLKREREENAELTNSNTSKKSRKAKKKGIFLLLEVIAKILQRTSINLLAFFL